MRARARPCSPYSPELAFHHRRSSQAAKGRLRSCIQCESPSLSNQMTSHFGARSNTLSRSATGIGVKRFGATSSGLPLSNHLPFYSLSVPAVTLRQVVLDTETFANDGHEALLAAGASLEREAPGGFDEVSRDAGTDPTPDPD